MKAVIWSVIAACFVTGVFWQTVHAQPLEDQEEDILQFQQENQEDVLQFQQGSQGSCRTDLGYVAAGPRLCMTGARGPLSFANALVDCKDIFGRVADYGDWRYRVFRGDGFPAPVGWWLGPITADDTALVVNTPNVGNFDAEASRLGLRNYACAHDQ